MQPPSEQDSYQLLACMQEARQECQADSTEVPAEGLLVHWEQGSLKTQRQAAGGSSELQFHLSLLCWTAAKLNLSTMHAN